jgi:hypothetical protein
MPPRPAILGTLDDPTEATPEADAEAARQLARALVINRVGAAITWEETLRKLGMDVDGDLTGPRDSISKELEEVLLDSTRRKRRKKMKKHKSVFVNPLTIVIAHLFLQIEEATKGRLTLL